jgi:two-component system, sensor histidine kinase and response regulator
MTDTEIKPSVLIVDDVEANLVTLEALLGDMSCELVRANGGNEALGQLLKREFAVMLLDVQMPEIDGYEVAKYARENPATRDVPIVFLTAMHDSEQGMLRGYGTGAVDFLLKPINAHVLRAKVRVFLDLYTSRRRLADEVDAHKKTLAALEITNEALRHFTYAASHDLKAPLRAVRGFLGALSEQASDRLDATGQDYLVRSIKASKRMDSLLDSLLSYARLQRPASLTLVSCETLVEQVRTDLAETIAASDATLEAVALPTVRGDADRLYQLFLNLISNALKFRRPDVAPRVTLSAKKQVHDWNFCVEDNGIGIDPQHQGTVFKAFWRLHAQSKYEGSGLGLAICEQIVEQHGGRIWVESAPVTGTRFCFTLTDQ